MGPPLAFKCSMKQYGWGLASELIELTRALGLIDVISPAVYCAFHLLMYPQEHRLTPAQGLPCLPNTEIQCHFYVMNKLQWIVQLLCQFTLELSRLGIASTTTTRCASTIMGLRVLDENGERVVSQGDESIACLTQIIWLRDKNEAKW